MKGMSNNQIILSEAEKLAPATLHAIATAHHTAAQIEALAAQITVTEDDGTQHPGTTHDAEIMLAASELHTFDYWKKEGKSVKLHEKALIECYLWKYTTKPSKAQREAAEAEGKEAAPIRITTRQNPTCSAACRCRTASPPPLAGSAPPLRSSPITRSWQPNARPPRKPQQRQQQNSPPASPPRRSSPPA